MTQLKIIFLGTSGSWPTIKRSAPSVAIKRGSEVLLFDCGEGTQRQLQKSKLSYMQISKIFITHFHGPKGMIKLVNQLLSLGYFAPSYSIIAHELDQGSNLEFKDYKINVLRVKHGVPTIAYCLEEKIRPGKFNKPKALELGIPEGPLFSKLQRGETITLNNGKKIKPSMVLGPPRKGRKIVISGDTKPVKEMIDFARFADVLIHEATFDSSFEDISSDYGHSTAQQAATIAKKANVEKLLLTHISPRYLDSSLLQEEAIKVFKNSFVVKDFQDFEVKLKN